MSDELDTLRARLWQDIPDHCAGAAVDAGPELDAEQIAHLAGAATPATQAAVIRAVTSRDQAGPLAGLMTVDEFLARHPTPQTANWPRPRPSWNGIALCCPKGRSHRIGAAALRFGTDWQVELHNAGRDAAEHFNGNLHDATQGRDTAERADAFVKALRSVSRIQSALSTTDSATQVHAPAILLAVACVKTAVATALKALYRQDPDGVCEAMRPTLFDPLLCNLAGDNPFIRELSRFGDAAVRAAGARYPWEGSQLGDSLQLSCPHALCRYTGSYTVTRLIGLYAIAVSNRDTRLVLPN